MNRNDVEKELKRLNIDWHRYNLAGGDRDDSLVVNQRVDGRWEVYYSERGLRRNIEVFSSEEEACSFLLTKLVDENARLQAFENTTNKYSKPK
jgi:hypothetical protein